MSIYIKMPIQHPFYEDFRARYLELMTANGMSEKIQDQPLVNEQETHYLVGSWRLTQEIANQLVTEFPMVTIVNNWPIGWATKDEAAL